MIREYLVQMTSPKTFAEPLSLETVLEQLHSIQSICHIADETEAVTSKLLELIKLYPTQGKQIHDANIVATMLVNDIDTLLTMNIVDLKHFSDRINLIPLT